MVRLKEYIIRFDIPMQNIILMHWLEGIDKLLEYPQRLLFRYKTPLPNEILQGAPLTELINQINVAISLDHFYKIDNIDVMFKLFENTNFIFSQLNQPIDFLKFGEGDHFDGYIKFSFDVDSFVDLAVLSFAEIVSQCVIIDNL